MTKTEELKNKYPLIFSTGELEPINLFGLECDEGWFSIIENVCSLFYGRYNSIKNSIDYYKNIIENKDNNFNESASIHLANNEKELEEVIQKLPKIEQIKEKFGTLRIYTENIDTTSYTYGVIDMAEAMSCKICEKCGKPGKLYMKGWHKTLCEEHAIERYGNL